MTRTRTFTRGSRSWRPLVTSLSFLVPAPAQAEVLTLGRACTVTNHTRYDFGVRRVGIHYRLSQLARQHSIAMANRGYIFHTANPSAYYLQGMTWSTWGENVGVTGSTVGSIQRAFMNSPPHRANILNRRFHRVAIGTYRDANGFLWVTVFFYG